MTGDSRGYLDICFENYLFRERNTGRASCSLTKFRLGNIMEFYVEVSLIYLH